MGIYTHRFLWRILWRILFNGRFLEGVLTGIVEHLPENPDEPIQQPERRDAHEQHRQEKQVGTVIQSETQCKVQPCILGYEYPYIRTIVDDLLEQVYLSG